MSDFNEDFGNEDEEPRQQRLRKRRLKRKSQPQDEAFAARYVRRISVLTAAVTVLFIVLGWQCVWTLFLSFGKR